MGTCNCCSLVVVFLFKGGLIIKHTSNFSAYGRRDQLKAMASETLDLLVIGGGITGAGIALDAISRGLRVGLVEKQDFAAGTSSRSTKLIHGGLRYLKQFEIKLVREVGRERAIVYKNAPHLVIPEQMLLPLVKGGTYSRFSTSFGLWLYDYLAGVNKDERRTMKNKEQTEELEPLLRKDILTGGGLYIEYRTDDARLTIEIMKTAFSFGAMAVNYTQATGFIYEQGKIAGAEVSDLLTGEAFNIYAKKVVNAAGPWADQLRDQDRSLYGKRLHLTKGVHLVIPRSRFPMRQAVYFDVPDGRMIFAIPRDGCTYLGTTDTNYTGSLERPVVTKEDVEYLLGAVNNMFPTVHLTAADICSSWAGLRPLIHEDGKSPSELSRKDEIFQAPSGLITIAGGKLTGYRKMAERVVDLVAAELQAAEQRVIKGCHTDQIVLSGGKFSSSSEIGQLAEQLTKDIGLYQIDMQQVNSLINRFGSNTAKVVETAKLLFEQFPDKDPAVMLAISELKYCIEEEMTVTLNDFLIRRTGRLFFERNSLPFLYLPILDTMAELLDWDEAEKERNLEEFERENLLAVTFA